MSKDNEPSRPRIVIIGAGIAGLSAAFHLAQAKSDLQPEILVLERSSRAGGIIGTYKIDHCLLELGPDAFLTEKKEALDLCHKLGLENEVVGTNPQFRRSFIAQQGQLHPLPRGFSLLAPTELLPFFNSPLMSASGKLRMMGDLLLPAGPKKDDESLAQFVRRRFGQEALDCIAQPMLAGIYTGDPEKLSLHATMPRFVELEQKYGSVIRGLSMEKRAAAKATSDGGARYSMFASLKGGMEQLIFALIKSLPPDTIQYRQSVSVIERGTHGKLYDVVLANGTVHPADAVIISTPAYSAASLILKFDTDLGAELSQIPYASSCVLNLIFNRKDIPHALDGFGFVVPKTENRHILACSFSSVKFTDRCPEDKVTMRVFVGGALQDDVYNLLDEQIECLIWQDLNTYLGVKASPLCTLMTRHPLSMPQYNLGHLDLLTRINKRVERHFGLALAGNAYAGVGIPDSIRSGEQAAQKALQAISPVLV